MDTPPRRSRTTPLLWLYAIAAAALLAIGIRAGTALVGGVFPGFLVLDNGILVSVYARDWTGPRAGLPFNGGVVASFDGQPFPGGRALLEAVAGRDPGVEIEWGVAHGDELRTWRVPTMRFIWRDQVQTFGIYLLVAAILLGSGGLALGLRPDSRTARSLAATLGSVGGLLALAVDHMSTHRWTEAYHVFEALAPASILNLALVFPRERAAPPVRRAIVGGLAALLLAGALAERWLFQDRPGLAWSWDAAVYLLMAALGVAMIASFADSFARGRDPIERTRAALVFTGGLVGFLLPAVALFAFFLLDVEVPTTWWTPFLAVFALFLLYAIVRHDLLEAERVVRLGVGYALATVGVLFVYATGLALLSRFVWTGAERSPVASFVLVLAVAISFEPLRQRVQKGIDRVFYRSRVDVAGALEAASADLSALETEAAIGAYLEAMLERELGCDWVRARFGAEAVFERAPLALQSVVFRGERLGSIACGPKRSGAPYSSAELDLVGGLASQAGLAVHHVRTLRDLRAAQETLIRTERLAAVGHFAGAVAHGIRNPLAGIRAAAQVAHLRATRGEFAIESLANVVAESDRLDQRIRSLLDFSRPFEIRRRPVDLGALLEAVRATLRASAAHPVAIEVRATPLVVGADPAYLEEALLELGHNAVRAMPQGGTLHIELDVEREPGLAVMRFRDSGGGVPEGIRARVFELFFTTRREGSGLGLATVKKIVELHGGSVHLESSDARGSVFRVEIPIASNDVSEPIDPRRIGSAS